MGDSDEDVDYKRRDKFRSERRGFDSGMSGERGGSPSAGGRREWRDTRPGPPGNSSWGRTGDRRSGGYYDRRDRYDDRRHEMSPPSKRMRGGDWDDRYDGYGGGGGGYHDRYGDYDRGPGYRGRGNFRSGNQGADRSLDSTGEGSQPLMMSFKSFLATQDDTISDEEAIKKYADYKLEFKRQQLNEFFVSHKDEEWFRLKYHPEDSVRRRAEQRAALRRRAEVFQKFLDERKFDGISIDSDQSDGIVKLLDSVVILLEGGTDYDLEALCKAEEGKEKSEKEEKNMVLGCEEKKDEVKGTKGEQNEAETDENLTKLSEAQIELQQKAKGYLTANGEKSDTAGKVEKTLKRKRTKEFDDHSSDGSSSDEEVDDGLPPGMDVKPDGARKKTTEEEKETLKVKSGDTNDGDHDENDEMESGAQQVEDTENKPKADAEEKPKPLHKVTSIFLRNLSPTITKQEVEAMCKRYPGFLRAAIADPQPERRWFRRGWVTFERDVKIKEICFNLNNIRLRECELGPIVNRDLQRRIRTVNGITVDKKVVRNDIKIAAKVITNLDKRWSLWEKHHRTEGTDKDESHAAEEPEGRVDEENLGLSSNNPILSNITDYLIEEASAEEEELLGKNNDLEDGEEGEEGNSVTRDSELITVLDCLLFYLRIVHSIDFYNHSEYPNEDEMPNRCGIMHSRGIPPGGNVTQAEIEEYCSSFCKKMGSFIQPRGDLSADEASKLGMKNEEDEVEKFVQANTQELGKDKWLCPLSGKKFKGPDFIRKHIFNKHAEKVEEVKKEVQYYNNYLKDPKRPQNLETMAYSRSASSNGREGGRTALHGASRQDPYHYVGYPREATNYPVFEDSRDKERGYHEPRYGSGMDRGYRGSYRGRGDYGGRGRGIRDRIGIPNGPPTGRQDIYGGRPVITYRDLDAPRESDDF